MKRMRAGSNCESWMKARITLSAIKATAPVVQSVAKWKAGLRLRNKASTSRALPWTKNKT